MTTEKKTPPGPWSELENRTLLSRLYFPMLDSAHAGKAYNKAAMIREAQNNDNGWQPLSQRSKQSIEFKLMNATAAHRDLLGEGTPPERWDILELDTATMHGHGYRAMPNYQADLKEAMREQLAGRAAEAEDAEVRRHEQRAGA